MATRYLDIDGLDTVAQTVRYLDHVTACGPRNTDTLWDYAEYFGVEPSRDEEGGWEWSDSPLDFSKALYGPYGRLLDNVFEFESALSFLLERCRVDDFSDLHVGDFFMANDPDGEDVAFQIAGFNVYRDIAQAEGLIADDTGTVTLLADRCFEYDDIDIGTTLEWSPIDFVSWWEDTTLEDWGGYMLDIPLSCETRTTDLVSSEAATVGTGALWAPSEIEVWGSRRASGPTHDWGNPVDLCDERQLPIFAYGRARVFGDGSAAVDWATRSPYRGADCLAGVSASGTPCAIDFTDGMLDIHVPVGFHLGYPKP